MDDERWIEAAGAQFVDLGAVAAIIDDSHQQPMSLAADGLDFLNMHQQATVALDQQYLAVAAGGSGADGGGKPVADSAEVADYMNALRRAAAQMRHGNAEVVPTADHHLPVLGHDGVELEHRLAGVDQAGSDGELLPVRPVLGDLRRERRATETSLGDAAQPQRSGNRLRPAIGISLNMQVGGAQALPQPAR